MNPPEETAAPRARLWRWMRRWLKWLFLLVLTVGGLVGGAVVFDLSLGALVAGLLLGLIAWFFGG